MRVVSRLLSNLYCVAAVFKFQVFNSISTILRLADMSSAPPKQLATPEDTFTALAAQFNFDNRIKDKILELGIRTLAEFRHYPRTDEEVKKLFVDSLTPSLDDIPARLQAARLRFAWNSCKAMLDAEHAAASLPPASTEDETLLPTSELDSLKEAFYHIRPEPRQFPSDRLLSKLSRQLCRGQLEVMDLWTVRSLTFQRTHSQKRRKVGDGLYPRGSFALKNGGRRTYGHMTSKKACDHEIAV